MKIIELKDTDLKDRSKEYKESFWTHISDKDLDQPWATYDKKFLQERRRRKINKINNNKLLVV